MENLTIEKTVSTPLIHFDAAAGRLEIQGESYPENVAKFYTPVLDWIKEYLSSTYDDAVIRFDIPYFNSSTSKILLVIFDLLEQGVKNGKQLSVKWMCQEENEMAFECGEEFKEDLEGLTFEIEQYE